MTLKTKIATGLIATLCSGVGTYELLRNGVGHSLDAKNEDEMDKDAGDEHGASPDDEAREKADADVDAKGKEDTSPIEPKPDEKEAIDPKVEAGSEPDKPEETPEKSSPKPDPQSQTYKEYLSQSNKGMVFVDEKTTMDVLKNIMLHRMFPNYRQNIRYARDRIFKGNREIKIKGSKQKKGDTTLFILNKQSDDGAKALRESCIEALNQIKPVVKGYDSQIYKIKA